MPRRIDTPCSYPGCSRVSRQRYCEAHGRAAASDDARERGTSAQRGYDARHRRWRRYILARDPICQICESNGVTTPASIADHIEPLDPRDPRAGNWSVSNGQGLCRSCHAKKTASEASPAGVQ